MGEYLADFRSRALPAALAPYFVRASSATDKDLAGVYSTVLSGVPAFDGSDGLILETATTDQIRNNSGTDAVAGTPGTDPTGWSVSLSTSGLTKSIVGTGTQDGVAYTDIRLNGTAAASSVVSVITGQVSDSPAVVGEVWTSSAFLAMPAGSTNGLSALPMSGILEFDSEHSNVAGANSSSIATLTGSLQRISYTRTLTGGTTAFIRSHVRIDVTSGQAIDITLRIGWPQMEKLPAATSPIPTTTAAVTRALATLGSQDVPVPLTVLGLTAQPNEYSGHIALKTLFSSSVVPHATQARAIFAMGGVSMSSRQLRVQFGTVAGSLQLFMYDGASAYTATISGLVWAAGDVLNIRWSKGATNGLIFYVNASSATNTTAGAKAAWSVNMYGVALNTRMENTHADSFGIGVYRGFNVWDRALSDAELSALTLDSLNERVGSKYTMGLGLGLGL